MKTKLTTYIEKGVRYQVIAPYSEVCMHMKIAGKPIEVELLPNGRSAQVYVNGERFSFPITYSEAGIYWHERGQYYYIHQPVISIGNSIQTKAAIAKSEGK